MVFSLCYWNTLTYLHSIWFITFYFVCIGDAFQRYPYILPKCCQSHGNSKSGVVSMAPVGGFIGSCENEESVLVVLPKQLFPSMSTHADHVEVELRNIKGGLKCGGTQSRYLELDIAHPGTLKTVSVGKKEVFDEVAFSKDNLLAPDGHLYSPHYFCISSGKTNKTNLAIETCKRRCSQRHPCIRRCCGGHQSLLTSHPTLSNESFLGFCSSPSLRNDSWNPWTSKIVKTRFNETRFYQTRYTPNMFGVVAESARQENCFLLRFTETTVLLQSDGSLVSKVSRDGHDRFFIDDNYCLDGINGETERYKNPHPGDDCEASEQKEVVVVYVCSRPPPTLKSISSLDANDDKVTRLPACSCLASLPDTPIKFPLSFPRTNSSVVPLVRLTTGDNGGSLECRDGYEDVTQEYGNLTMKFIFFDGLLILRESLLNQEQFCIRSLYNDAVTVRTCKGVQASFFTGLKWWHWLSLILQVTMIFLLFVSICFYVAIAVVYILRNDKEVVLRTSIVCYSISSILTYFLVVCNTAIVHFFGGPASFPITLSIIAILIAFCFRHAFSWMSVLCFDVWFNMKYLRPGRKSVKRLWGYVAFAFTFPVVLLTVRLVQGFLDSEGLPSIALDYLVHGLGWGITGVNFILFISTAVKLWIAQSSSDIKNQRNMVKMYFKLFLLMGLRWVIDFVLPLFNPHKIYEQYIIITLLVLILLFLHPVILFFFLIWDAETKAYLETKHPRVKRAVTLLGCTGYPVRKCWDLCRRCKRPREEGANGIEGIEQPHNSAHMYVHTRRAPNIPKFKIIGASANQNEIVNETKL